MLGLGWFGIPLLAGVPVSADDFLFRGPPARVLHEGPAQARVSSRFKSRAVWSLGPRVYASSEEPRISSLIPFSRTLKPS